MKTLMRFPLLLLALLLFCCCACKKHKHIRPVDQLPPATQEGKNTMGFLLNGEPWTPKGFNGTANLSMEYDPTYSGGVLGIAAYRIINNQEREYFSFGVDSIDIGTIKKGHKKLRFYFSSTKMMCEYDTKDDSVYWNGELNIAKIDTTNGVIVSGTFSVTLYKSTCDSFRITEGRFDMSLN